VSRGSTVVTTKARGPCGAIGIGALRMRSTVEERVMKERMRSSPPQTGHRRGSTS
jgi:hypothetical protein